MEELGFAIGSYLGSKALDYGKGKLSNAWNNRGKGGKKPNFSESQIRQALNTANFAAARAGRKQKKFKSRSNFGGLVSAPVVQMRKYKQMGPGINYHPGGEITISHTERFGQVNASVNFNVQRFECNPGIPQMAHWLTNIAKQYEYYTIEKWECQYKPKCSTDTDGDVTIMVDYDAGGATPSSSVEMENFVGQVNTMPWKEVTHHSTKTNLKMIPNRLVRTEDLSAETVDDRRLTDWGVLYVASEGQAAAIAGAVLGYLYSTYTIRFHTPRGINGPTIIAGTFTSGGTESATLPFGDAVSTGTTTHGMTMSDANNNRLTFARPGAYFITVSILGTGLGLLTVASTDTLGTSASAFASSRTVNAGLTIANASYYIDVIHPGGWVGFTLAAFTTVSNCDAEVVELNTHELPQALSEIRKQRKLAAIPHYVERPQKAKFEIRESLGDETDTESVSEYKVVPVRPGPPPILRQPKSL